MAFRDLGPTRESKGSFKIPVQPIVETEGENTKPIEGAVDIDAGKLEATAAFAGSTEVADGFNVLEVDTAQVAPDQIESAAEEAALRGEGKLEERGSFEEDSFAFVSKVGGGEAIEFGGPEGFFAASPIGGTGQGVGQRGIDGGQDRDHFVAEAVSEEREVGVGGIFSPGEVTFG